VVHGVDACGLDSQAEGRINHGKQENHREQEAGHEESGTPEQAEESGLKR